MTENIDHTPLAYRTLLSRRSCRRFDSAPLSSALLQQIEESLHTIQPLQPGQAIQFSLLQELEKTRLAVAQGAYGRFIVSPHLMIPYTLHNTDPLVELGFQSQQAVFHLETLGLGSCYIGAHGRVLKLQKEFDLPEEAQLAAVLVFGTPSPSTLNHNLNQSLRSLFGSRKRKPLQELLLPSPQSETAAQPREWEAILQAGRWAPSATNAQPWRLLRLEDNTLQLFTNPAVYPFVLSSEGKLMYALFDAGIFMANILLAAQAFGVHAAWQLHRQAPLPQNPSLIPLARLTFS